MRKTTEDAPRAIRWNISLTLEDLDFADILALLSHTPIPNPIYKTRQIALILLTVKFDLIILVDGKDLTMNETLT